MKVKNVCIFVAIILLIIIVAIILANNNSNIAFALEKVQNVDYVVFKSEQKYGVINKNGEILVNAIYDEIDIPNPSKDVFICKYDYNSEKDEYKIKVINKENETILYQYFIVEAITQDWNNSEIPFEKSVLKFKQKRKIWINRF